MKQHSYTIKIEKPCNQSWASMEKNEVGKHCNECAKNVYDFTNKTDQEIIKIIEHSQTQLCGMFAASQLDRTLISRPSKSHF